MPGTDSQSFVIVCREPDLALEKITPHLTDSSQPVSELAKNVRSLSDQRANTTNLKTLDNDPDIVLVKPQTLTIGIAEIRDLQHCLSLRPQNRQTKVAIVSDAGKLSPEAQNALLKTLEEPPTDTLIILLVTDLSLLLPTVISRCQVVFLPTPKKDILPASHRAKLLAVLSLISQNRIPEGFAWAKAVGPKRTDALDIINQLLEMTQKELINARATPKVARKLFQAKKYLQANTNVRLTLENLFLD